MTYLVLALLLFGVAVIGLACWADAAFNRLMKARWDEVLDRDGNPKDTWRI